MNPENPEKKEPGIVSTEIIEDGNTALLHIRQVDGEILSFTVPTRPLVRSIPQDNSETQ